MTLPIAENIPEIDFDIEGLRMYSFLCAFLQNESQSETERKIQSWLLHTVFSATRHYTKARDLVVLQNNADQQRDGGAVLHLLDVSEQVEDCIAGVYRSCMAIRRMTEKNKSCECFIDSHSSKIDQLSKIRNQFEHMHAQIVFGETGNGPISIIFSDEGSAIIFRKLKLDVVSIYELLKGLYTVVASMYSGFDANSSIHPGGGPVKLTISADWTYTSGDE